MTNREKLLIRCRSVLVTALSETPEDLKSPARKPVIKRLIRDIDLSLKPSNKPETLQATLKKYGEEL